MGYELWDTKWKKKSWRTKMHPDLFLIIKTLSLLPFPSSPLASWLPLTTWPLLLLAPPWPPLDSPLLFSTLIIVLMFLVPITFGIHNFLKCLRLTDGRTDKVFMWTNIRISPSYLISSFPIRKASKIVFLRVLTKGLGTDVQTDGRTNPHIEMLERI